jgi:type III pantothenate kinase
MENSIPDNFPSPPSRDNLTSGLRDKGQIKIALAIGNSRLHWGLFAGPTLEKTWDTEHLNADAVSRISEEEKAEYLVQTVSPLSSCYSRFF